MKAEDLPEYPEQPENSTTRTRPEPLYAGIAALVIAAVIISVIVISRAKNKPAARPQM
jgi:hypothetical protein